MRPTTMNNRSVLVGGFVEDPVSRFLWLSPHFRASNRPSQLGIQHPEHLGLLVIFLPLSHGHLNINVVTS